MAETASTDDLSEALAVRRRAAWMILSVCLLANVLLMTVAALGHPYSRHDIHWSDPVLSRIAAQHQVFLEALLLASPAWLIGTLIVRRALRTGIVIGVGLISLVPVIFAMEAVAWLTMGTHLFSAKTWELLTSFLPWLSVYTKQTNFLPLILVVLAFVALQGVSIGAGVFLARRQRRKTSESDSVSDPGSSRRRGLIIGAALLIAVLPLGWRLWHPAEILASVRETPDRHPLAATGLFVRGNLGDQEFPGPQQVRVATHFIRLEPAVRKFEEDYESLTLTLKPERKPDVLVIIAESLRHNALTAKSAPNLTKLAEKSLTSQLHYSGGNASELGFFGLLYGLDTLFYDPGMRRLSPALPKLMREAGYFTAFLGHGDLDMHQIELFINDDVFDLYSSRNGEPFYVRDEEIVSQTQDLFARRGQWQKLQDQSVFAVLFLFSTHAEYHYRPEDEVFLPSPRKGLPTPPWTGEAKKLVLNRYHNSVHGLDRIVSPLLADEDRVIVFLGDHGESFGEDQRMIHGTALSSIQTRTPLIVRIPGEPPSRHPGPTSHEDLLPTLLEALGSETTTPNVLTGRSLLAEPTRQDERFSLRATVTTEHMLMDFRQGNAAKPPAPIFRFEIDLWKPWFRVLDANDADQHPVEWSAEDARQFEASLAEWLDNRLRTETGPIETDPLPQLISILNSENEPQIEMALNVLLEMGPDAKPALKAISRHLTSSNAAIRSRTQLLLRVLE